MVHSAVGNMAGIGRMAFTYGAGAQCVGPNLHHLNLPNPLLSGVRPFHLTSTLNPILSPGQSAINHSKVVANGQIAYVAPILVIVDGRPLLLRRSGAYGSKPTYDQKPTSFAAPLSPKQETVAILPGCFPCLTIPGGIRVSHS